jgi:hypothetical protein
MSYSTENFIPASGAKRDITRILELMGYAHSVTYLHDKEGEVDGYEWFDKQDYRSWSGVSLGISQKRGEWCVSTTTSIGRSFYDLQQQWETAAILKRMFGGRKRTDGKNWIRPLATPPTPAQSGCYLAFDRFGHNLIILRLPAVLDAETEPPGRGYWYQRVERVGSGEQSPPDTLGFYHRGILQIHVCRPSYLFSEEGVVLS